MYVKVYCNTSAFVVVVQYTIFHSCTAVSTTETFHTWNRSFRTTWHVANETPALTVMTTRYSYRMLCWFSQSLPRVRARPFPPKPCEIHHQPDQTGSWIGKDPKESVCRPTDAHPGDHEALNKKRRWPGLERGTSSLERYLSQHILTVSKSVHVCTKTPPLCSSLNTLQYSVSLSTALRSFSPVPLRPVLGPS